MTRSSRWASPGAAVVALVVMHVIVLAPPDASWSWLPFSPSYLLVPAAAFVPLSILATRDLTHHFSKATLAIAVLASAAFGSELLYTLLFPLESATDIGGGMIFLLGLAGLIGAGCVGLALDPRPRDGRR